MSDKRLGASEAANQAFRQFAGNQSVIELDPSFDFRLRRKVINVGAATTLNISDSGALVVFNAAAGAVTLPAITTDPNELGTYFDFIITVSSTSAQSVTAAAADLLVGGVNLVDFDAVYTAPQGAFYEPDGTDDLIMSMNGTTTGGKIGSAFCFTAISATRWYVEGTVAGDGVLATPFA